VHRGTQRELDLPAGQLIGHRARVGQRPREAVELGHHQRVTRPTRRQRLAQPRAVAMRAGQAVVDVDALQLDAQRLQGVTLGAEILGVGGDAGIADLELGHVASVSRMSDGHRHTQANHPYGTPRAAPSKGACPATGVCR